MEPPLRALIVHDRRRAVASGWRFSGVSLGAGLAAGAAATDRRARPAALGVGAGAVVQLTLAQYQLSIDRRRHAAFQARLDDAAGRPEALQAVARDARMEWDRQARFHALATGANGAIAAAGAGLLLSGRDTRSEAAAGLALQGLFGLVHHALRWRASSRFAADFDTLSVHPVPTLPPPR